MQRLRLSVACLALTLIVFAQNSGSVAADTKLDLVVDPARFLKRSLSLWDPVGSAGQLQDQAYGYLFPMGPFFLLGHWLALPPWVVQRSWESAVLVAAFLGIVRLSRLLGIRTFWPRVAAGAAYALAPRMLSELFSISSELLPVAVLPWMLIPLVRGSIDPLRSPRQAAAWSAVALLFAGGINASATLAILPAPALWLLTRSRGPRRAALIRWWVPAVLLACLWWLLPLVVLGRYSPPFLDWIESAAVTTTPTSLAAVLRGVDHWLAYLGPTGWPAGWVLVVVPAAILATSLVAALGLAGLARRSRNQLFLVSCLLVGLVLLTLGHRSTPGPPLALDWQRLLDGPANAFRNVHKFDPLVRLPLALGLGHLLARFDAARLTRRWRIELPLRPAAFEALALLAVAVVAVSPALGGRMVSQPRPVADPGWWAQAAGWLAGHDGNGRALVVPGAGRPNFVWGQTVDDPMQPLATSPWTVRDALPLTQPGYVRLLDQVDTILAAGRQSETLPALLSRAGVRYLVVRNDLDTAAAASTRLDYLHATLASSPGLRQVAGFGPDFGGDSALTAVTDQGAWPRSPAVQIFSVAGSAGLVSLQPQRAAVTATGSADALATLAERGLRTDQPVLFEPAGALSGAPGTTVATDGIRRREIVFGNTVEQPATLAAGDSFALPRAEHDYLPADPGPLAAYRLTGLAAVRASSSGASVGALLHRSATSTPYSAVDGDPATAWRSGTPGAVGQWFELDFTRPVDPRGATLAFAAGLDGYPDRLRVQTDAGVEDSDVAPDARSQPLQVPAGVTRSLRITVLHLAAGGSSVGIAELTVPGVHPGRTLDVPMSGTPDVLAFDVAPGYRASCLPVSGGAGCPADIAAAGEEDGNLDRSFRLAGTRAYHLAATVRLRPSRGLTAALDALSALSAKVSSTEANDPRVRAGAAVDGDPRTTWIAETDDRSPTLTVRLPERQRLSGIRLQVASGAPVSRPFRVRVHAGNQTWTGRLPADGIVRFHKPTDARTVSVTVQTAVPRASIDPVTRLSSLMPTGISELTPLGTALPPAARSFTIGCTAGLVLTVDGRDIPLHAEVPVAAALAGTPVLATPCRDDLAQLAAGRHRLQLGGTSVVAPVSLTATADGVPALGTVRASGSASRVLSFGSTDRRVQVRTSDAAYLLVRENANPGWHATLNGHRLTPVMLDGWAQGYLLPAGSAGIVHLVFAPQATFTAGLVLGLLAVLGLLLLCWWPPRTAPPPPVGAGRLPWLAGAALVAGAGFALLGGTGLLLALVLLASRALLGPDRRFGAPHRWAWLAGGTFALAGLLIAIFPPGSAHSVTDSWLGQVLSGVAVLATASAALGSIRLDGRPSRSNLRSNPNQVSAATPVAASAVRQNNSTK